MNFAALVERLRMECAVSGPEITTVQGTLPREIGRLTKWIITAWEEVQLKHPDWEFLRIASSHSIPQYASLLNPAEYAAGTVSDWKIDTFRLAASGAGFDESVPISFLDYETWRITDGLDSTLYARPNSITVRIKDKALFIGPSADVAYELYYDYYRTPQALSADADIPLCPARFHMAIVYRAMQMYGRYEAAPEVLSDGVRNYRRMLAEMENDQLPAVQIPGHNDES